MTRLTTTIFTILAAVALCVVLFTIKQRMQGMEEEMTALNRDIFANEQSIHVLKAEWSHLNDPRRLRELASQHLGLSPVRPEQLGLASALPKPAVKEAPESSAQAEAAAARTVDDFFSYIQSALANEKAAP